MSEASAEAHHHAHVHTVRDRATIRIDRLGLRQEVGVLDPEPLLRAADHGMMQDLHRRGGAFGLRVRDLREDFAFGLERGKYVVAGEELAGFLHPVLAERGLHSVHHGSAQPHADVTPVVAVLTVAKPAVDDAVAALAYRTGIERKIVIL